MSNIIDHIANDNLVKLYDIKLSNELYLQGGADDFKSVPEGTYQGPSEADVKQQLQSSIYNRDKLNYMEPSKTTLYTIPRGTILYHGSLYKESFNPFDIRLNEDKLVSYFSPNKRLAADYIVGCALYPTRSGYLHKFRVKKNIEKIMIVSTFEKKTNWTLSFIEDTFCSRKFRIQLDGIGFFFPRRDEQDLYNAGNVQTDPQITFDAEFAICDPNEYLEYISTQRCVSMRKLSVNYHFNK
jgi:hypothetical protein